MHWQSAKRGQSAVYADIGMRAHFMSSRERIYGSREVPGPSVSTSAFVASVSEPLVLTAAHCQVWTNSAVMAALSLSSYPQLVNVALLAGNDFTKEHTNLWGHLMLRLPGRSKPDRWALFVTQPAQRDKQAEEYHAVRVLLSGSKVLRRAFRQSRAIYEGIDEQPVAVHPAPATASPAHQPAYSTPPAPVSVFVPSPSAALSVPISTVPRSRARVYQVVAVGAYGFLRGRPFPYGLFFHQRHVVDGQLLSEGDEVEYEEGENERLAGKKQALRIEVVQYSNERTRGVKWEGYRPPTTLSSTSLSSSSASFIAPSGRPRAFVSRIMAEAGYGFLGRRNNADSIFFHQRNVVNSQLLSVGDEVEYDEGASDKDPSRMQAMRIQVVRFRDEATRGIAWIPQRAGRLSAAPVAVEGAANDSTETQLGDVHGAPMQRTRDDSGETKEQRCVSLSAERGRRGVSRRMGGVRCDGRPALTRERLSSLRSLSDQIDSECTLGPRVQQRGEALHAHLLWSREGTNESKVSDRAQRRHRPSPRSC